MMTFIGKPFEHYFQAHENAASKGLFFAIYAKNSEKMSIHRWFKLRKHGRHGYGQAELKLAVRDQLLKKISSLELRTKLFEEPNIQLAVAIDKARAWETAQGQASSTGRTE